MVFEVQKFAFVTIKHHFILAFLVVCALNGLLQ